VGIGVVSTKAVFAVVQLLIFSLQAGFAAGPPTISVRHLKTILRDQGFSGALDKDTSFKNLGVFACGPNEYRIFYFVWSETRPDGSPGHGQQRIIIVGAGEKYIGSYWINDPPLKVMRDVILVSGDVANDQDEIRCVHGELPNDETHLLGK
jgi:hypothetical protein